MTNLGVSACLFRNLFLGVDDLCLVKFFAPVIMLQRDGFTAILNSIYIYSIKTEL